MRGNKKIRAFSELQIGEKVIDLLSGMVYEYEVRENTAYLSTDEAMFPVSRFQIDHFERYFCDKNPGEKEYGYF